MAPTLGLGVGLQRGAPAPITYIWGVPRITGDSSYTLNTAEAYSVEITGNIPAEEITYSWSIVSGDDSNHPHLLINETTSTVTVVAADVGTIKLRCTMSSDLIATNAIATTDFGTSIDDIVVSYADSKQVNFGILTSATFDSVPEIRADDDAFTIAAWVDTPNSAPSPGFDHAIAIGLNNSNAVIHYGVTWEVDSITSKVTGVAFNAEVDNGSSSGAVTSTSLSTSHAQINAGTPVFIAMSIDKSATTDAIKFFFGETTEHSNTIDLTADELNVGITDTGDMGLNLNTLFTNPQLSASANSISECMIFDKAMTVAEMSDVFNSGTKIDYQQDSGDYDDSASLIHYWRFGDGVDEKTGSTDTINDLVANNDITLISGTSENV